MYYVLGLLFHSQMILWPQISKYNYWNSMHFIYFVKSIFNESLPHRVGSEINVQSQNQDTAESTQAKLS